MYWMQKQVLGIILFIIEPFMKTRTIMCDKCMYVNEKWLLSHMKTQNEHWYSIFSHTFYFCDEDISVEIRAFI